MASIFMRGIQVVTSCFVVEAAMVAPIRADTFVGGQLRDTNDIPIQQAPVTLTLPVAKDGADATTVFTDDQGRFVFGKPVRPDLREEVRVQARALGYRMVYPQSEPLRLPKGKQSGKDEKVELLIVMQPQRNDADAAPASAWMQVIPDTDAMKPLVVRECSACHQLGHAAMRDFVRLMDNERLSEELRTLVWQQQLAFMYGAFNDFIAGRMGISGPRPLNEAQASYLEPIAKTLAKYLPERMDFVEYDYGAPWAVTPDTRIQEYTVPNLPGHRNNALGIYNALLTGEPVNLWLTDVARDHLLKIDPRTGRSTRFPIAFGGKPTGVQVLIDGEDRKGMQLGFLFQQLHGLIDPDTERITIKQYKDVSGRPYVGHDYVTNHLGHLVSDSNGLIWIGDVSSNSLVAVDRVSGRTTTYALSVPPQDKGSQVFPYGSVMTADRKHVWYTQVSGGLGEFNTETRKNGTVVGFPKGSGPRRLTITDEDILYVPLFGSGQLLEYDARARKTLGLYDVPDRASAPHVAAWDPGRKVVWIATTNGDVIYRFDPRSKSFSVLPMPRPGAFMRTLQVHHETGYLVTAYAPLPDATPGVRMGVIIDPGDERSKRLNAAMYEETASRLRKAAAPDQVSFPSEKITAAALENLSRQHLCSRCHRVEEHYLAPSFKAIGHRFARHAHQRTVEVLTAKILYGGAGNWGVSPMNAQAHRLDRDDARVLADAILRFQ